MTRQDVVDAAIVVGDERDLDAVTIRQVATSLGVTPMALYRHVAGKDDLLDAMADELYAELRLPEDDADWWDGLAALARSTRQVLLTHPWAVPLFARPLAGEYAQRVGDTVIDALRRAGFTAAEARELHGQLTGMVFALIAPELSGRRNRAAFERGLDLLRAGLESRQQ